MGVGLEVNLITYINLMQEARTSLPIRAVGVLVPRMGHLWSKEGGRAPC